MKKIKYILLLSLFVLTVTAWMGCKKETTPDPEPTPAPTVPGTSSTELVSLKTTTAPVMDGNIDGVWANCSKLINTAVVPNITDFAFYTGEQYSFTIRSMYDASNIYYLVEYTDPKRDEDRQSWYFDTGTGLWKQQHKFPVSDNDKFYEDKFAFLWPTASTDLANWNSSTCYSSCHDVDKAVGYNTGKKHYADPGEVIDMWHWKLVRTGVTNQTDDQNIVPIANIGAPSATEKKDGGRSSDDKTTGGVADNVQALTITGTSTTVNIPKYVIPAKTGYSSISQVEIDNGTAKLITAVDSTGVLTYAGGTIDPKGTTDYANGTGSKRFPSVYNLGPMTGSRGDLTTYARHTGTGWVIEIKRSLTTTDAAKDVQYDISKTYMFGFAIFENAAIAHGIKPNLLLKFAQ